MSLSPELLAKLRASASTVSPVFLTSQQSSDSQIATLKLAILAKLSHPNSCEIQDWLGNMELTAELRIGETEIAEARTQVSLSYNQWLLVNETAFQLYRHLRFGTNLEETRPLLDQQQLLALTLQLARKLWTSES